MNLVILGSGGYGKTIEDIASQIGKYSSIIFLDDNSEHPCSEYIYYKESYIYPAFGNNEFRMEWIDLLLEEGYKVPTIIHPSAYISPTAKIGVGTTVLPKAIISTDVVIEKGCIINIGSIIDHGNVIEEGCHICVGAIVKAENRIQALSKIEAGQVIMDRVYPI